MSDMNMTSTIATRDVPLNMALNDSISTEMKRHITLGVENGMASFDFFSVCVCESRLTIDQMECNDNQLIYGLDSYRIGVISHHVRYRASICFAYLHNRQPFEYENE